MEEVFKVYLYPAILAGLTVAITYVSISNKYFKSKSLESISSLATILNILSFKLVIQKDGSIHYQEMEFNSISEDYNTLVPFFEYNIIIDKRLYDFDDFIPFLNDVYIPIEIKKILNKLYFSENEINSISVNENEMNLKYIGILFSQKDKTRNNLKVIFKPIPQLFKPHLLKEVSFSFFINTLIELQNEISSKTSNKLKFKNYKKT